MQKNKYDLIIVGGGVLGAFSALHALRLGKTVALIEKNKMPQEATVRNFGQIVPSGLSTDWKKYGLKSLDIYKELQSSKDFSVRAHGSYYIASCDDESLLLHELAEIDNLYGYQSEILSPALACKRVPGLRTQYCKEGLYYPEEVSVDPRQMIHRVIEYMISEFPFDYFPYTIAQHFEYDQHDDCEITTNYGKKIIGEQLLICNGAEFQLLLPEHYTNDETSCVKIHMLITSRQPTLRFYGNILTGLSIRRYESFRECPSYNAVIQRTELDERIPKWGIHILFKQTDHGQVIIGDSHHYANAHDKEDLGFEMEEAIQGFILDQAKEIFNLDTFQIERTWTGIYAQAKHSDIISKTIDQKIHILNAIGGKGMTAGPGYTFYHTQKLFGHD